MIYTIRNNPKTRHPLPIEIKLLGISHRQEPIKRAKGMHLFQWFFCVKGKGEFILDSQRSIISEGQGLLIYPDIPHSYKALTEDWRVHFIGFNGPVCSELLNSCFMPESGVCHLAETRTLIQYIQKFQSFITEHSSEDDIAMSALCYEFLTKLGQAISHFYPSESYSENELVQEIITYLKENYTSCISLDDIAQNIGRSKEYMCYVFKRSSGQTIITYLKKLRISHARIYLIQYPQKPILEIAKMCGFESSSYFGKCFKAEVGITPEQYRKT